MSCIVKENFLSGKATSVRDDQLLFATFFELYNFIGQEGIYLEMSVKMVVSGKVIFEVALKCSVEFHFFLSMSCHEWGGDEEHLSIFL